MNSRNTFNRWLAIAGFVLLIVAVTSIVATRLFVHTRTPIVHGACGSDPGNVQNGSQPEANEAKDVEDRQSEVDCKDAGNNGKVDIAPTGTPTITPPKLKRWLKTT